MPPAHLESAQQPTAADDLDAFVVLVQQHNKQASMIRSGEDPPVTLRAPRPSTTRKLILIVDDDRALCQLIREALEANGYAAHVEHNGAAALQFMREDYTLSQFVGTARLPSLIMVSWELPAKDGFHLVGQLMTNPNSKLRGIEIMILSSHESDAPGVLHLDADDFDEEKLLTMVRSRVESTT